MARASLKNVMRLLDEADSSLPAEESFLKDLKRSIEITEDKIIRKPSKTYKPSSMNCIRNMYYQVTGADMDPSSSVYTLVGICNSGSDIHERVQKYVSGMKENGMDCEYVDVAEFVRSRELGYVQIVTQQGMETKLYHTGLNMSFLCDGIIRYNGKYYILEIKTESSFKFQNRRGVDPKHYNQATAYSIAFGIDDVLFVYINRDVLDMKAFMFTVTGEMRRALKDKIRECNNYVDIGQVPPKPDSASGKFCQYCNYAKSCARVV